MEPTRAFKTWRMFWMGAAMLGIVGVIFALSNGAPARQAARPEQGSKRELPEAVRVEPGGLIVIDQSSLLAKHLEEIDVAPRRVKYPALTVSGQVLARIRPGTEPIEDRWQFSSSDLAAKYAEWLRVTSEIGFAESQLQKTQELAKAQTDYLSANVRRLEPLVKSGSVPEREFRAAQAELLKAQLQGEKDIFTAQSTLRVVRNSRTALERELSHLGIDPVVFGRAVENMVLIAANVPETKISQVHEGQECLARFYAYPDNSFDAHVEALSPQLSSERRTLRVLFELSDAEEALRPGMFAEVGLGTDEREALLIPAEALVHVSMTDYVLVAAGTGVWRPVPVRVGEQHAGAFEVLQGLHPGDTIVGGGAILLKPALVRALRSARKDAD